LEGAGDSSESTVKGTRQAKKILGSSLGERKKMSGRGGEESALMFLLNTREGKHAGWKRHDNTRETKGREGGQIRPGE